MTNIVIVTNGAGTVMLTGVVRHVSVWISAAVVLALLAMLWWSLSRRNNQGSN
ncbi:MAG: hypothetical protein ABSG78_09270 [Verrucomicrobiota bacterium]|jgi:sensor c-di-GMP phosphodiesterase-like protein